MDLAASQQGKRVYEAHVKVIFLTCWSVWILIMAASIIYMLIAGIDIAEEWQRSKDMILFMTSGVAAMSVLFPAFSWQQVEVDELQGRITIRNLLDKIFSKNKEFGFRDIRNIETKSKPKRGDILYLELKDGSTYKVNITNLKDGRSLKSYLNSQIEKL